MPAAAVIPAPIAYIKVVAVKKLVVGSQVYGWVVRLAPVHCSAVPKFFAGSLPWVLFAERPGWPARLL